ncbi:hypothetical protein SD70_15265 [Gordoniibacillus kamchatkensis]|uniref:Uncharacterized protein n=1 Tax=Gordoniibacillus kamchatkensis TaxID=1590651 RepID=A0ABR5AGM1_9BACL|nr:hypothetical protein [Paenibacillus sp. VKM B-2647]KIL40179.1 hypothetical protein SD70_15265 [Paenibacillus sp. VKM B-2647]
MSESFQAMAKVPAEWLAERLETVRELKRDDLELYEIAKDRDTGEHYLHYAYVHRDFTSGAGAEETFHQLMALSSDDVLGLLFENEPYSYPDHWHRAFLRNGPEGFFVWFDPVPAAEEAEADAAGRELRDKLLRFKQSGVYDEQAVRKLFKELDGDV